VPTAYLSPSQLRELTDVSVNPGSGQNNFPLTWIWNNTTQTGQWQASNNIAGVTIRVGAGTESQAIGTTANSTGPYWIAQGQGAARDSTSAEQFLAQGSAAGRGNGAGSGWFAQGTFAGVSNTLGSGWFAQGAVAALFNSAGSSFMAQGSAAGYNNTLGSEWTAQGSAAAFNNTLGAGFLAQGYNAANSSTLGSRWQASGYRAGYSSTTADDWLAVGYESGYFDTRSNVLNIANSRSKSLICGLFDTNCIYFGNPGPITSTATVPVPTAAVHAAASNTTRASLRIDSGVAPTTPNTGDIWVTSSNNSLNFQIPLVNLQGTQVLATRRTGWTAPTGTATRTTFATFAGQDISATPTEAEVQAIDDHVKVLSERLKALIDDLTTHGLIGP